MSMYMTDTFLLIYKKFHFQESLPSVRVWPSCPSGELSWWEIALVGNHPSGELSWWGVALVGNCPSGEFSWWGIVLVGSCPSG